LWAYHHSKIKFLSNHRNRKVVGGKQNVPVYHLDATAPDPEGIFPATLSHMRYFVVFTHTFILNP
jgi:hypothetical protein